MICILSGHIQFVSDFGELCALHGIPSKVVDPRAKDAIRELYQPDITAAVVDASVRGLPDLGWFDMLASLSRRIPIVAIGKDRAQLKASGERGRLDAISWLKDPQAIEVLTLLDACGALGIEHKRLERQTLPLYTQQVPLHMLQSNGALSLLVIDAASFRKIAIEYGTEVYHRVQDCFHQILLELWGAPGSFRSSDVLCRRSAHGNAYFIFLEQARSIAAVPAPGVLERLADRLTFRMVNRFWTEVFADRPHRRLPDCIRFAPDLTVGFATAIFNPCVDALEQIEQLIDAGTEAARIQLRRVKDRQRELMQTLIHTPGLLTPHYQAVFHLPQLTRELVERARDERSIRVIAPLLFGFESLIRVRPSAIEARFGAQGPLHLEAKYLRPDVLFGLSHAAKISLELDQACLKQAVQHAGNLPGMLLVNILPRNLYNIERLRHSFSDRQQLMFEVSESEAINNLDLMIRVRSRLEQLNLRIAADDFGRGYSGLEQLIKIKPDLIKLDRSLITDIHCDPSKQAFVSGLVQAAKFAAVTILAEGVEQWEEAAVLQTMGIDLIQGFLLHKPQAPEQIAQDLRLPTSVPLRLSTVA